MRSCIDRERHPLRARELAKLRMLCDLDDCITRGTNLVLQYLAHQLGTFWPLNDFIIAFQCTAKAVILRPRIPSPGNFYVPQLGELLV